MSQLGGFLLLPLIFSAKEIREEVLKQKPTTLAKTAAKQFENKRIDKLSKNVLGSKITQINYEVKDIMKIIRYLKNRLILLKVTTRKMKSQERGLFNFLVSINESLSMINEKCIHTIS